jgi:hypothetical protein
MVWRGCADCTGFNAVMVGLTVVVTRLSVRAHYMVDGCAGCRD